MSKSQAAHNALRIVESCTFKFAAAAETNSGVFGYACSKIVGLLANAQCPFGSATEAGKIAEASILSAFLIAAALLQKRFWSGRMR